MICSACKHDNDVDAAFCDQCGGPLAAIPVKKSFRSRKAYLLIVVSVLIMLVVAGLGYYKFILPDGIAAVVNNEEITLSELDAAVLRERGEQDAVSGIARYQVLNEVIAERLVLQEAKKAGLVVSPEEVAAAVSEAQTESGRDAAAFQKDTNARYGSMQSFDHALEQQLIIRKFLSEKVVPQGADPQTERSAVNRWLQETSGRAMIRIALAEQGGGGGCGNCAKTAGSSQPCKGMPGQGCAAGTPVTSGQTTVDGSKAAGDAGLRYWHEKHGNEAVTTKVADFGCHLRVDILKNEKIIGSLRYQNGAITEQ